MLAFVVAAGDEWKRSVRMGRRRTREDSSCRIAHRQSRSDAPHAPRAAEIQSIEMHEFRIGSIGNDCRLQELLWLITRDARQKAMKPRGEFGFRDYAAH